MGCLLTCLPAGKPNSSPHLTQVSPLPQRLQGGKKKYDQATDVPQLPQRRQIAEVGHAHIHKSHAVHVVHGIPYHPMGGIPHRGMEGGRGRFGSRPCGTQTSLSHTQTHIQSGRQIHAKRKNGVTEGDASAVSFLSQLSEGIVSKRVCTMCKWFPWRSR
ncbi:hypothetical protein N657DRAFT_435722 [Parathielavia appendiculata]|uniref:Uncharacterized protein n=1 Tax=Parathielavia appendiculata TaxID=2587402 RepID=A0AAN6U0C7_9PEZI|nr:hypothetical protein N657DRAFT_435722 [Parathielavia appendiculata]